MTNTELRNILEKHQLWLDRKPGGERANLEGANLFQADLEGVNLRDANLERANLVGANLRRTNLVEANLFKANLEGANIRRANLFEANLRRANLVGANLVKANLREANLVKAILYNANLKEANLERADLEGADLRDANLIYANLERADLEGANLIKTKGLLSPIDYLAQNFEKTADGYIVYKVFGMHYPPRTDWTIKDGSIIEDIVNIDRAKTCGYGINVATKEWIKKEDPMINKVWKCLIKWEWLPGVVVPYATDGKIRCERLMLLEKVDI